MREDAVNLRTLCDPCLLDATLVEQTLTEQARVCEVHVFASSSNIRPATRPAASVAALASASERLGRNGRPWPEPALFRSLFTAHPRS